MKARITFALMCLLGTVGSLLAFIKISLDQLPHPILSPFLLILLFFSTVVCFLMLLAAITKAEINWEV